jgi:hypothetical protein
LFCATLCLHRGSLESAKSRWRTTTLTDSEPRCAKLCEKCGLEVNPNRCVHCDLHRSVARCAPSAAGRSSPSLRFGCASSAQNSHNDWAAPRRDVASPALKACEDQDPGAGRDGRLSARTSSASEAVPFPPDYANQELLLSTVTARRFCDQQEISLHTATGRSLP